MSYCTLLTSDDYLPGAVVLAARLKALDPHHDRTVMVTPKVSAHVVRELANHYKVAHINNSMVSHDSPATALRLLGRPELGSTLAKIAVWTLTNYEKVVFLDADVLPLKDVSGLFGYPQLDHAIAASPDVGWPDVFNSGVFATKPDAKVYQELRELALAGVSFDGGDQGLLNEYFKEASGGPSPGTWIRAPFTYNVPASHIPVGSGFGSGLAGYQPAYDRFRQDIAAVHFLGAGNKPWTSSDSSNEFAVLWNRLYSELHPFVSPTNLAESLRNKGTISADVNRWEPSSMPPPLKARGEAMNFSEKGFTNVWDGRAESDGADKKEQHSGGSRRAMDKAAPAIPAIFPWELQDRVVTRVFDDYVVSPSTNDEMEELEYIYGDDDVVEYVEEEEKEDLELDSVLSHLKQADSRVKSRAAQQAKDSADHVTARIGALSFEESDDESYQVGGRRIAYPVTPFASIRGRRPTGLPGLNPDFEDDEEGEVVNDIRMRKNSETTEEEYGSNDEWDPSRKLEELRRASDRLSGGSSIVPDDI